MHKGVYIDPDREQSPYESVIDIIHREKHLGSDHSSGQVNSQRVSSPDRREEISDWSEKNTEEMLHNKERVGPVVLEPY